MRTGFALSFAFSLLGTIACSSGEGPSETSDDTLAAYCTGTMKVEKEYRKLSESGWSRTGAKVPPGTLVYVAENSGRWGGYAILPDGALAEIDADLVDGLARDVDFTSACLERAKDVARRRLVFMKTTTLFADAALTQKACSLEAGTGLTSWTFTRGEGSDPDDIKGSGLKDRCGVEKGYAKSIPLAPLFLK